ncbi:MAG: DUF1043 family protein [Saccharospirillaceae bacterium]|nr:YhcB family protein [Pseudomonadales bacterium]NRB80998.1 DUF1043 family protein [Saccharospirillaceae bacterium]
MLTTIGLIAIGIGIGMVIYHYFILSKHGGKSLANQLDELKKEHQKYQFDVSEHFQETTQMLDSLNQQYEKVQLHIQSGAELLTQNEPVCIDQVGTESKLIDSAESSDSETAETSKPKDYA